MQRLLALAAVAGTAGCLLEPTFVAITPDYGYVDGCTDVALSGHHLGTDATASIGGVDLPITPAEEDPSREEWAQDVGFLYYAATPPAPAGAEGFQDVTLTVDGEAMTLPDGFFYRACPASFQVDGLSAGDGTTTTPSVAVGDDFGLNGCGLSDEVTVRIMQYTDATLRGTAPTEADGCGNPAVEAATASLVSDCGTARARFAVPALPDGTYALWFVHSDGTVDDGSELDPYYKTPVCSPITFTLGGGA